MNSHKEHQPAMIKGWYSRTLQLNAHFYAKVSPRKTLSIREPLTMTRHSKRKAHYFFSGLLLFYFCATVTTCYLSSMSPFHESFFFLLTSSSSIFWGSLIVNHYRTKTFLSCKNFPALGVVTTLLCDNAIIALRCSREHPRDPSRKL